MSSVISWMWNLGWALSVWVGACWSEPSKDVNCFTNFCIDLMKKELSSWDRIAGSLTSWLIIFNSNPLVSCLGCFPVNLFMFCHIVLLLPLAFSIICIKKLALALPLYLPLHFWLFESVYIKSKCNLAYKKNKLIWTIKKIKTQLINWLILHVNFFIPFPPVWQDNYIYLNVLISETCFV